MALLAKILLRDFQFNRRARVLEVSEERRRRLANLEIDRAVLDLHKSILGKFAVEAGEELYSRICAVLCPDGLVQMDAVIHECAEDKNTAMRLQSFGKEICPLRQ